MAKPIKIHGTVDAKAGVAIGNATDRLPLDPAPNTIWASGNDLLLSCTINGTQSWLPLVQGGNCSTYMQTQAVARADWVVNHNLNAADLWVYAVDIDNTTIHAVGDYTPSPTDPLNSFTLNFPTAVTGHVFVVGNKSVSATTINAAELNISTNVKLTSAGLTVNGSLVSLADIQAAGQVATQLTTETNRATAAESALSTQITQVAQSVSNVNNTADIDKPVSTAQAAADSATLLSAMSYAAGLVVGLWDDRGNYDASGNVFPTTGGSGTTGDVLKGDIWTVSVAGIVGGVQVAPRQTLRAVVDAPGQNVANWAIGLANTDIDDSITAGITGRAPSQNAVATAIANEVTARNAAIAATSTGVNSGDETAATIKSKLGITTLSGGNTGDETQAGILAKLGATAVTGSNTGDETTATIKSKLGITTLSGSNTGDQTITLTGDVTGSGTGSFAVTIPGGTVTPAKMASMATASLLGRNSAGTGTPEVLSATTVKTLLSLNNLDNTSDVNKPVSVAQAAADTATLTSAKSYADSLVVGLWDDRGNYDASVNTFPAAGGSGAAGAILKGDIWTISVAGTLGGTPVALRQTIRATVDAPGQTATNWAIGLSSVDIEDQVVSGVTGKAPSQNAVYNAIAAEAAARDTAIAATSTGINTGDETATTIKSKLSITTLSGSNTGDETQATILSKLGATAVTGSNTGDETAATIKTKLGITTLSGSNTGDETNASILSKLSITSISGVNTGDETTATIKTKLGITTLSGSNTGDQTITLTGDITGSGTGSFATTIPGGTVTLAKMASMATASLLGRNTAGTGVPEVLTPATVLTMLGLGNVNNTSDANKPVSTAQAAANATTLASAKSYADGLVVGLWDDRGNYDASVNTFPASGGSGSAGAVLKGDIWTVSVAGTVGGTPVVVRQTLRAMVDAPGQTATNWAIGLASTDVEDSVTLGVTGRAPSQNAVAVAIAATSTGVNTGDETATTIKNKLGITTLSGSNTGDETNASLLSKLSITSISGVNTGDETAATIRTKLGITTLSGSNTGDETQSGLLTKLGATALTGSNTGDETAATIKTKLSITTLSGSNTGDETQATILTKLGAITVTGSNTGDETQATLLTKLGNSVVLPSQMATLAPYDISAYYAGIPPAGETIMAMVIPRALTLPASLTGSVFKCSAVSTSSVILRLMKNGVSIGTVLFNAGANTVSSISVPSSTQFAIGDILTIIAPTPADATFGGAMITLATTLN